MDFSYSKLALYRRCPFAYKHRYIDGHYTPPTPAMILGSVLHKALEDFYRHDLLTTFHLRKPSPARMNDCFDRAWRSFTFPTTEDADQARSAGFEILKNFHATFVDGGKFRPAWRVEQYFEIFCGAHRVRGYIDRIDKHPDGSIEVVDYKSDKTLRTQEEIDKDLQLAVYFLGCARGLNVFPQRLSLLFLRHAQVLSTTRYTQESVAAIEAELGALVEEVATATEFPAKKNCYCASCPCNLECGIPLHDLLDVTETDD